MTTKRDLNSIDFMMMDVHRPLTEEDLVENPQAVVDRSLKLVDELRPLDPLPENVEVLDVLTSHRLQVNRVLQSARDQGLDDVMVIGWRDDGPIYLLTSDPSISNSVYRLELAKQKLLAVVKDRWEIDLPGTVIRDDPDAPA